MVGQELKGKLLKVSNDYSGRFKSENSKVKSDVRDGLIKNLSKINR